MLNNSGSAYAKPAISRLLKLNLHKTGLKSVWAIGAISLTIAGCATPQATRFYTLSAAPRLNVTEQTKAQAAMAPVYIEIPPVAVPERFKRPQLVVSAQAGGAQVNVLEQDRWSSPFNEELRDAFASQISTQLHAVDITYGGRPMNPSFYRIAVVLHALDVSPGNRIYANFGWTIKYMGKHVGKPVSSEENDKGIENTNGDDQILVCQTTINKPAGNDIKATVTSIQAAVAEVSAQISGQLKTLSEQGNSQCSN